MLTDIHQIMHDIWSGFLQLTLKSCEDARSLPRDGYTGKIIISGGDNVWNIYIHCADKAAKAAAGAMFMADPATVPAEDIEETVAELTNMVGGNIKTLLPGHNTLSLPEVSKYSASSCTPSKGESQLSAAAYMFRDCVIAIHVFEVSTHG